MSLRDPANICMPQYYFLWDQSIMFTYIRPHRMFSTSSHLKSTTLNFLITLWHKEKRLKEANHGWKPLKI